MRKILVVTFSFLLLVLMLSACSFSTGDIISRLLAGDVDGSDNPGEAIIGSHLREAMFNTDSKQIAETIEFLMESVENRDLEQIRQLFSDNTIASVEDLDEQITSLIDYYEGSTVSVSYKASNGSGERDAGLKIQEYTTALDVSTTEKEYCLAVKYCTSDTEDPGNIGIQSLYIIQAEYTDPVLCYWGEREWNPGIVIQDKTNQGKAE